MSAFSTLASLLPNSRDERRFDTGEVVIRDKTFTVVDAIYPIANISTVAVADTLKPLSAVFWIPLILAIFIALFGGPVRILFFFVAIPAVIEYFRYLQTKKTRYQLSVLMNGGNGSLLVGNDFDFLKAIALELFEAIERDIARNVTFNLGSRIAIDNVSGSTINLGTVNGDLANNVREA